MTRQKYEVRLTITVEAKHPQEAVHRASNWAATGSLNQFKAEAVEQGKTNWTTVEGLEAWVDFKRGEMLNILHFGTDEDIASIGLDPLAPVPDSVRLIGETFNVNNLPSENNNV